MLAASAVVLYAVSISGDAYEFTTPVEMPHHILLRKTYAILAFALLGFLLECAAVPRVRDIVAAGIAVALYSWAIEFGQIVVDHSRETFAQHGFDVASGLAGGALGAFIALLLTARTARVRRAEGGALVLVFAVLAWFYTLTYGPLDR